MPFVNRLYRATLGRTPAGSPIVTLVERRPLLRARHRQLAAFLYELAAEMERQSEALGARWVISAEAANARIVLELGGDHERVAADAFIAKFLGDHALTWSTSETT